MGRVTGPQRDLADYCEWLSDGSRRPCYAAASLVSGPLALVLVRPSGETLRFTCTEHAPAWVTRIRGEYLVLERDESEAGGAGYRARMLGG